MKLMLVFLHKYRLAAAMALLMMFIELCVELVQPLMIAQIIDHGIAEGDGQAVLLWGGLLAVGAAAAFASGIASSFFAAHASQGLGYDIRETLYARVQSFSYAVFNRFSAPSLVTRLTNDVTQLQDTVFMMLRIMMRMPLLVVGSVIMALVVHAELGLLLTLTVPALLLFVIWIMKKAARLYKRVQQRIDAVNGVMQENLSGMRLIRIFVRRREEGAKFERYGGELMDSTVSALRLTEITMPFILLIMNAGLIAVLWFGQAEIRAGSATTGEVVAVVNYSLRIAGALSIFSMIVAFFSRARASAQRIGEVLETDPEEAGKGAERSKENDATDDGETREAKVVGTDEGVGGAHDVAAAVGNRGTHASRGAGGLLSVSASDSEIGSVRPGGSVEFANVTFRYPGSDAPVLTDISFRVNAGETAAILGATGAGKSTLVQLLLRLYEEDAGTVRIGGVDANLLQPEQARALIGYVPQEVLLFAGTVAENISWGKEDATREEIVEAAKLAQIHETIVGLSRGYETMLGQRGVNLSGGQKQRLSIARALIRKPAILLLDDSTSALDVRTEAALMQALGTLRCTTILITQKISSAAEAEQIILLDDGRLIGRGTHDVLLGEHPLYRRIWESQAGKGEISYVANAH